MGFNSFYIKDTENIGRRTRSGTNIYIGLDCETSSRSLSSGGKLIQFGISFYSSDGGFYTFSDYVRNEEMAWDSEAELIHGISYDYLADKRSAVDVDNDLYTIIKDIKSSNYNLVAVGYNVGSFDLPFFNEAFPLSMSLFSHRVVDLNSLCFLLDSVYSDPKGLTHSWSKPYLKDYAHSYMLSSGVNLQAHDAGYDAAEAIISLGFIQKVLGERPSF